MLVFKRGEGWIEETLPSEVAGVPILDLSNGASDLIYTYELRHQNEKHWEDVWYRRKWDDLEEVINLVTRRHEQKLHSRKYSYRITIRKSDPSYRNYAG